MQRRLMHGPIELRAFVGSLNARVRLVIIIRTCTWYSIHNNMYHFVTYRSTERKLTVSVSALGVPKNITLDSEDDDVVCELLKRNNVAMNEQKIVTLQPKIIVHDRVIFSKGSRRVQKINSYTVTFTDPEVPTHLKYGRVKCFITCPPDSPDSVHIAVIEGLEVQPCIELLGLRYPPEIQCLISVITSDFVSIVGEGNKVTIPIEHIVMKCFDVSTRGLSIVTTLVSDSEVTK